MKKLIVTICVLIASTITAFCNTREAEYRALLEEMLSLCGVSNTNVYALYFQKKNKVFRKIEGEEYKDLRLEYDTKLAEKGLAARWGSVKSFPKISENSRRAKGLDVSMSNTVAIAKKHNINITPFGVLRDASLSPDEIISVFNDFVANGLYVPETWWDVLEQYFDTKLFTLPRDYLQSQGKEYEINVETGVDPCAVYVEAYMKAIQAPRLEGFNDWLASLGISNRVDVSKFPTEERIAEISSNVLNNVWVLTPSNKMRLRLCLGNEGYNEFMEKYTNKGE